MFGFGNVHLFSKCKASRERLDYVRNRLSKSMSMMKSMRSMPCICYNPNCFASLKKIFHYFLCLTMSLSCLI